MADGYQYRTVVTGLNVTEDARRLLEKTIDHWQKACHIATDIAWPATTEARAIQSAAYDPIREQTALGSQHSILATRRVSEALKSCAEHRGRGHSPSKPSFTSPTVTYDPRCMTVFDDGTVSLATTESRVRCDLKLPTEDDGYQQQFLDATAWKLGESTLTLREGEFRLHLGFKRQTPAEETAEDGAVLGVDLGVKNIAVTSTAQFFSGEELQHVCRQYAKRRRSLEEVGTRSAHLTARRLAGRERRYIENALHMTSSSA